MARPEPSARRYIVVIQSPDGYPPPGAPLEPAPPDGPAPPVVHTAVLASEYEVVQAQVRSLWRLIRTRPDGWPLCPQCGEDQLHSPAEPASIDTITGCNACNWTAPDYG